MTPARDLRILKSRAQASLARIRRDATVACSSPQLRAQRIMIAYCTVELLNLWSIFTRSYFLSCVLRPKRAKGGRVVCTAPVATFTDAITVSIARHKNYLMRSPPTAGAQWSRRDEPTWHDPAVLRTGCADLGCSHSADVQAALALPTRVFLDLPVFRNYFGHRNSQTQDATRNAARRYTISGSLHPTEILASHPAGRPYPLLVDWIDDMTAIADLLCD
jgi:hypothetical protein